MDSLDWLQRWYAEQCDGDWEHSYGVRIATLDNPGWSVSLTIAETLELERTLIERTETNWLHLQVKDGMLEAACGPLILEEALSTLRRILEEHLADRSSIAGRAFAAKNALLAGGFEERSSDRELRVDRGGVTVLESPLLRVRSTLARGELSVALAHPRSPMRSHDSAGSSARAALRDLEHELDSERCSLAASPHSRHPHA